MKKISEEIIKKYLLGEDIEEFSIEELENDSDFIFNVIDYSNDIKIYNLCSDSIKKDYFFVKKLIFRFKDNESFIINVADYYLNNSEEDLECRELNIIMSELIHNTEILKYKILADTDYYLKRVEIEMDKSKDSELEPLVGMGFLIIFDEYNSSEIITNFYARELIKEILKENNICFEKMLHNQFKSNKQIEELGVNNYFIKFINCYDSMLGSYISTHLDLIKDYKNEIENICANWDNYNIQNEKKRYLDMFDMVRTYLDLSNSNIGETEIIYYVASELGIVDNVKKYDYVDPFADFDLELNITNDMAKFEIERSLKERLVYLNVRKIMINQLFSANPLCLEELVKIEDTKEEKGNTKAKIIKLNKKNN